MTPEAPHAKTSHTPGCDEDMRGSRVTDRLPGFCLHHAPARPSSRPNRNGSSNTIRASEEERGSRCAVCIVEPRLNVKGGTDRTYPIEMEST